MVKGKNLFRQPKKYIYILDPGETSSSTVLQKLTTYKKILARTLYLLILAITVGNISMFTDEKREIQRGKYFVQGHTISK